MLAEPLLNLCDVGLVIERVRGGRRAQRVRPDLEAQGLRVAAHQVVNRTGRHAFGAGEVPPVVQGAEEGACLVLAVAAGIEVIANQTAGGRMQRHIAG